MDLRGYAVENTPALPNDRISGVSVSVVNDDGSGSAPVTGQAVYGSAANSRPDLCGTGKMFPDPATPNCPYVQFDYVWNSGLASDGVTFTPNGTYTATLVASDSSSPALTATTSGTFTVDSQPPSPVIASPVNGEGDYHTAQTFTVNFVSPHRSADIGSGQIIFEQSPTVECTLAWQVGGTVTQS